jgi:thiol-disulfide isomerase/thioredoxin
VLCCENPDHVSYYCYGSEVVQSVYLHDGAWSGSRGKKFVVHVASFVALWCVFCVRELVTFVIIVFT